VAIVKHVLIELKPGDTIAREALAKAIGLTADDPVLYRRVTAASNQLRREGVVIAAQRGVGWIRMTDLMTLENHQGRERKSICRKARRAGERLAAVDAKQLPSEKQAEYYAERTINNVVFTATSAAGKTKMLAAAKAQSNTLPMALALDVLKNGDHK
jgi:hypothetical protein